MARQENKLTINKFDGGLITDSTELSQIPGTTADEDNCVITQRGTRRRRRGLDFEAESVAFDFGYTVTAFEEHYVGVYDWKSVAQNGDLNFKVLQVANVLHFVDISYTPLTSGIKSFTVDLDLHKIPTAPDETATFRQPISVASGKGALFVCSQQINPFYITYNEATDSITTTTITIEVRDFDWQDTSGLPIQHYDIYPTIDVTRKYDLYNQGWYQAGFAWKEGGDPYIDTAGTSVAEGYRILTGVYGVPSYPDLTKPFWVAKDVTEGTGSTPYGTILNRHILIAAYAGNTRAPNGHYILEAFRKDRTTVSGLAGLTTEASDDRPIAVAFFAGRVFWALNQTVYFSQVLGDDLAKAGRCYQEADPTSENDAELVATDGGEIKILEIGNTLALFVTQDALLVFADNGIWTIAGSSGQGFSAIEFFVNKVTSIHCLSARNIVDAEGTPFWWSEQGIFTLASREIKDGFSPVDITDKKTSTFYNLIPTVSKKNAQGVYDPFDKAITWLYKSEASDSTNSYIYDRALTYDFRYGAFYPSTFATNEDLTAFPFVTGIFVSNKIQAEVNTEIVVDNAGAVVTGSSVFDPVTVDLRIDTEAATATKFWTWVYDGGDLDFLFSTLTSERLVDFYSFDEAGVSYDSYLTTHNHINEDPMLWTQSPYIDVYLKRTELQTDTIGAGIVTSASSALSSGYVSKITDDTLSVGTNITNNHNTHYILGENGGHYALGWDDSFLSTTGVSVWNVNTGALVSEITCADFDAIATANGLDPIGDLDFATGATFAFYFAYPGGSPYFVLSSHDTDAGSNRHFAFIVFKINSAGSVEAVGGWQEKIVDFIHVNDWTPSPSQMYIGINGQQTEDDAILATSVALAGSHLTIAVLPSLNELKAGWTVSTVDFGSRLHVNFTNTNGLGGNYHNSQSYRNLPYNQRMFYAPKLTAGTWTTWLCGYVGNAETQKYIDTPAGTPNNSFILANAATYPTGYFWYAPITIAGVTPTVGTVVIDNTKIKDSDGSTTIMPFSDAGRNKDGTVGSDADDYRNPNIQKITVNGTANWILLWHKDHLDQAPDLDPTGDWEKIRVLSWNPSTAVATLLTTVEGSGYDTVANIGMASRYLFAPNIQGRECFYHDGFIYVLTTAESTTPSFGPGYVHSKFATLALTTSTPIDSSVGDFLYPSSCKMYAYWDFSNSAVSHKVTGPIQVYRIIPNFTAPAPGTVEYDTGYPIVVTKNKVRGRGRALQLKFTSEPGYDFELLGWCIWFAKAARY